MMILRTLLAEFKQLPAEIGYILGWAGEAPMIGFEVVGLSFSLG